MDLADLWQLDAAGMRAHPARETRREAGLLLQATGGYTQRANSAAPLMAPVPDADAAVSAALDFYSQRGLPVTFRLPTFVNDAPLRAALDAAGFDAVCPTRVMTLALASRREVDVASTLRCEVVQNAGAWCALHDELSGVTPGHGSRTSYERVALVARIETTCLMMRLDADDETVGAGVIVIDDACAGLYSLVIAPPRRGQGFGAVLIELLLRQAGMHGAGQEGVRPPPAPSNQQTLRRKGSDPFLTRAYLQVAADNAACRLYERLGFIERYAYTYFVKASKRAKRGQTPF